MFYDEIHYLRALMDSTNLSKEEWLHEYFELYKSTVIWPPGLPPIRTCYIVKDSYMEKFHLMYLTVLRESTYVTDNKQRTLVEKSPDPDYTVD